MRLLQNPDIRILIANNTWDNSRKFLDSIRAYLAQGSVLAQVYGQFQTDRWNRDEIIIKQRKVILDAPTIATTGLEKEQTGQHYDFIVADDLVARENSSTAEQRQKVKDYINSLMALLEPNGELWIVGTRWSQDDAYGDLIDEGIWDCLIRSAYTDATRTAALFPEKFTLDKLQFLRKKIGPTMFSCWYLNDPIAPESTDFRKDWLRYWDKQVPIVAHPHSLVLAVDPASSLGRDADYSAFTVLGMLPGNRIRLVDRVRKRCVPSEVVSTMLELAIKWRNQGHYVEIIIESFGYQKTLVESVKLAMRQRGVFFTVKEFKKFRGPNGEKADVKNARIRALQPYCEQGLFEIRSDMQDFEDELLSFPRGKHDDLIDSASMGLSHLRPSLGEAPTLEEPTTVHWTPPTYRDVLRSTWNKQGGGVLDRYFNDLKQRATEPRMQ